MNSAVSNLRPHCSPIVKVKLFFYSAGPLSFLLSFSFSFPVLHSVSPFLCSLSLPLLDVSASLSDKTQAGASSQADFFFFFSLNALSLLYLSLSSLYASPMSGLCRLWDADGCGSVIVVMDRGSDGCGPVAAMEVSSFFFLFFFCSAWFCLCPIGLRSCKADTKLHAIKSLI